MYIDRYIHLYISAHSYNSTETSPAFYDILKILYNFLVHKLLHKLV